MSEDFFKEIVRRNQKGWRLWMNRASIVSCIPFYSFNGFITFVIFKDLWYSPEFDESKLTQVLAPVFLFCFIACVLQVIGAIATLVKAFRFKAEEYV